MQIAACLGLFLPLIGFLILMTTSKSITRGMTCLIGCSTIAFSFLSFVYLLYAYNQGTAEFHIVKLYHWISIKGIDANVSLYIDALSLLMTLIITGIGFLIHVYSIGYMDHDEDFARYFACLNFFIFAMLLLVLGQHLLVLFVGWEGVGLASYLLIGFWYDKPVAAQAATKAFVVNRIGDLGLLLGIILSLHTFGSGDMNEINLRVAKEFAVGAPVITIITLLFFLGATGKSAQIPLQTWLPDAMAGPTPVSALIHAATMVTAGVYLLVRLHPMFLDSPFTMHVVGFIGTLTALYAALCALGQTDLKRVLAYSTVSQLGYMFMACGAGAFYAAMFHLTTHAFVKALLFLSAGNVVHMLHGATEMGEMGGLAAKFPQTSRLFLIGVLALAGMPPFAAFFSKDLILEQEYLIGYNTLFLTGLFTAIITAFYLMRAYALTFIGKPQMSQKAFDQVQEAPNVMLSPVRILAMLTIFGGILGITFGRESILENFLAESDVHLAVEEPIDWHFIFSFETIVSIFGAIIGLLAAAWTYTVWRNRFGETNEVLRKSFYVDEVYETIIVRPLRGISKFIAQFVEPQIFDGMISFVNRASQGTSRVLQYLQSGLIRSYTAWIVLGTVFFIAYLVF